MKPTDPASLSRRNFLKTSGVITSGFAAGISPLCALAETAAPKVRKYPIGLELYSVRDELVRDLPNTLKTVAEIGYKIVEFYSPYFKWTAPYAKEVRSRLDDLGLRCYSTHNGLESFTPGDNIAHAIELNQILGVRFIVLASAHAGDLDGWKALCEKLATAVDALKPHGLSAGYHNHGAEWAKLDNGQRIMEVIAASTPKEFVLQLDVGTCIAAGADPVAWVKANPGRIKSMHLKDWAPGKRAEEKEYRVLFGEGVTPWKDLVAVAKSEGGTEIFLIEQEGSRFSEFETVKQCLANWKKMFETA